ncbi:MAG: TetR/AcrR family transcriptional regulator [Alphaproteobacteria bacterium]|nr:TetR/AcrR family transcriptional regulator [Alphaproteobacteria bacterium]
MARAASTKTKRAKGPDDVAERILETALEMAEENGWAAVRLRDVAARLKIPLESVLDHYRDLDGVADAWFRRAWHAMLQAPPDGFADQPPPQRIELIMMRWFDALAAHRRVTGEMLGAKMWYAHPHHWVPAIFNLSRTVQWIREVSLLDTGGRQRQVEEIGLTALFLAALRVWLRDETENQQKTRDFLRRRLASADRLMAVWTARQFRRAPKPADAPGAEDAAA